MDKHNKVISEEMPTTIECCWLLVVGCWGAKCCPFASMWPALFRCKAFPVAFESEWLRAGGHVFEWAFESSLCVLERSFSLSSIENSPSPKRNASSSTDSLLLLSPPCPRSIRQFDVDIEEENKHAKIVNVRFPVCFICVCESNVFLAGVVDVFDVVCCLFWQLCIWCKPDL